jgi:hypothetical protein
MAYRAVIQFWLVVGLLVEPLLVAAVPLEIILSAVALAVQAVEQALLGLPVVVLVVLELRVREMLAVMLMMVPQVMALAVVVVLALLVVTVQTQSLVMVA